MCAGGRTDRARRQTLAIGLRRPLGRSVESLLDGVQDAVCVAADLPRRHPEQALQVFGVGRSAADELHQRHLSHDFEGGPVHVRGLLFAVREEGLEDSGLCRREVARTLDAPECHRVWARVVRVATLSRQACKVLVRLRPVAGLSQRLELSVAQRHEIVRVEPRVVQLFRLQGTAFPIGTLILFVQLHAEVGVENGGEADLRPAECARGAHRVEDVRKLEMVVAPEADEVVLGVVEDLLLAWIGEEGRERIQTRQPDRIDDVVSGGGGELDEAHALAIGVEAVGFSIDGYDRIRGERAAEPSEATFVSDENRRWQQRHTHTPRIIRHSSYQPRSDLLRVSPRFYQPPT